MRSGALPIERLPAGGRFRWRASWSLALLLVAQGIAAAEPEVRCVTVGSAGDAYACDARVLVPVPQTVAWGVLTDFERMSAFVPNVRQSRVLRREAGAATVELIGLAKFGPLSLEYAMERRLELTPPAVVRAVQVRGTLRRFDSIMRLETDGAGTRIHYHVDIEAGFPASVVLSREFVEHEVTEQFGAVVAEMVRRSRPQ